MRAVVCKALNGIEGLAVEEMAEPPLTAGSVRIAVEAAGLNFADTLIVTGKYQQKPPLPFVPGFEVAGRVIDCGDGVGHCAPGDPVMALIDRGGFAEQVVARADDVFVLPAGIDAVTAAGFPVAYGTSHFGLKVKAALQPGETLLVHGAAGGVGLTAVECGKRLGATVIATASGPDKQAVAAAAGADHTLDARDPDLKDKVKALTEGRGVDVVYDPVGGALFEASLRCTRSGGRILIIGFASGEVPQIPANILMVKNISAIGYYYGPYRELAPAAWRASMQELVDWLGQGLLRPHVSQTYPLAEAVAALRALKERRSTGKVVLTV
ncbi:MAG: NADPH:quinone oxidoreductase family protein [Rhodospirillales bacterium]|jgi:NADPH2:quinone reductase|nr:NADPH:quinone oxidoreductase family protein [Rhodospirillales bacterium]